jgi:CelD/BcsL family acetyltransferase involved in cellulose biosynthesis
MTTRVARSVEEAVAMREAWERMPLGSLDAHPDRFLAVLDSRPEVLRPHVILREPDALLVARLEDRDAAARFGYATVHRSRLRCLTVVHGGAAGGAEPELLAELLGALRAGEAQAVFFHRLRVDSPLHRAIARAAPAALRQRFPPGDRHWACDLPDSYEAFLASLPRRKSLQRYARKLAKELGDRLTVERYRSPGDLERVLADLETVAAKTYQRGLGAGFSAQRDRLLVQVGLERGWFNAWVLYVDGEPRAFEHGDIHAGTYHLGGKGYDPDWAERRVGNFLGLRVWEDLCTDPAVAAVDFGFGDADYKREVATRGWDEVDITIHAPTPRGLSLSLAHSAVTGADRLARRLAGKERIAQVKRRWRTLRTPRSPA